MKFSRSLAVLFLSLFALARVHAAESATSIPWDIKKLSVAPATYPAPGFEVPGMRSLYFEGLPWQGKPTRVFAYLGIPEHKPGEKVPGIVLVHGGGGTAFEAWVKLWVSRGYAAIAMDTCGCTPGGTHNVRPRHDLGGPPGWGGFAQIDQPVEDQWTYHAVADVILAHSLLRAQPDVDADRIGITGISWGGYLTCIVAGVDERFRFAVPVYGCGFLGDDSVWVGEFTKLGAEKAARWLSLWDPSRYLARAEMPFLWVDGTNDFAYPLDSLQKSYRLPPGMRILCTRVRMPHGHGGPGENPKEIHAFADHILKNGPALTRITQQGNDTQRVWATYESNAPLLKAELNFTKDTGDQPGNWQKRLWQTVPAELDATTHKASAVLPEGATVCYLNLIDKNNLIVSTEHVELKK